MDYKAQTLEELARVASSAGNKKALVGFDGFVDRIMAAVDSRQGQGKDFTRMRQITDFGGRINAAAGNSANIELFLEMEKLGGNGPIMANAVRAGGFQTTYIGALGTPVHPVFKEFAAATNAVSVCDPGVTHAVEFEDGKIMLGTMASLDDLTYEKILAKMGEGAFVDAVNRSDLLALVNWTMIPNMTAIFEALLTQLLPNLGPKEGGRTFFFDLADPAKRSVDDLHNVLNVIGRFQAFGHAVLGLNLAESKQVYGALGLGEGLSGPEGLQEMATNIRRTLGVGCVVIHPREGAACATKDGSWYAAGPFCEKPLISTGAGDHFNAGFALASVLGLSPQACLTVAVSYSGQYVRTAKSPSLSDTMTFLRQWK